MKYHGDMYLESKREAEEREQMSEEEVMSMQYEVDTLKEYIMRAESDQQVQYDC